MTRLSAVQAVGVLARGPHADPPSREELLRRWVQAVKRLEFHGARIYAGMLRALERRETGS